MRIKWLATPNLIQNYTFKDLLETQEQAAPLQTNVARTPAVATPSAATSTTATPATARQAILEMAGSGARPLRSRPCVNLILIVH